MTKYGGKVLQNGLTLHRLVLCSKDIISPIFRKILDFMTSVCLKLGRCRQNMPVGLASKDLCIGSIILARQDVVGASF